MCSFELSSSTQSSAYLIYSEVSTTNWTEFCWDVFISVVIMHAIISLPRLFSSEYHKLNRILVRCVHFSCHHPCNHHLSSSILESAPQTELNSREMCSFELSSCMQSSAYLVYSQVSTTNWTELLLDVFISVVIIHAIISLPRLFSSEYHKLNWILVRYVHFSCHHLPNHQLGSSIFKSAPQTEQNCYQMCSFELRSSTQSSRYLVYSEVSTTNWTELWLDVFIWVVITHGIITFACLFRNQRRKPDRIMVCCIHWNQNSKEYINWLVWSEIEEDLWLCCFYKMFTYIVSVLDCFFLRSLWSDGWL